MLISYYHDIVIYTIAITITVDYHDNQLITTIAQLYIMVAMESAVSMDDGDYRIVAKHLGHSTAIQRCVIMKLLHAMVH